MDVFDVRKGQIMNEVISKKVAMFCPKCGHKIVGEQSDDGYLRITCTRCKASMVSKQKSRKENVIVLINPKAV